MESHNLHDGVPGAHSSIEEDLEKALSILRQGGIILYPTDTIWGIGCDATNDEAIRRIFRLKQREDSKSMLTLVESRDALLRCMEIIPQAALSFIEDNGCEDRLPEETLANVRQADAPSKEVKTKGTRMPTTIIYPNPKNLSPALLAADGSAGIRITSELFSSELCRRLGKPIVSTSANISGQPSPRFFNEISEEIRRGVDFIPQYRRDDLTPCSPSRIVKINPDNSILTIR